MKNKSDDWKFGDAEEFLDDINNGNKRMRVFDWTYNTKYMLLHPWNFVSDIYYSLKWAWQRVHRGWDDRVPWSIDYYLCRIMPDIINELIEHQIGNPIGLTEEEWDEILIKIRDGFIAGYDIMEVNYDYKSPDGYKKLSKKVDEGLKLFTEYFFSLWW